MQYNPYDLVPLVLNGKTTYGRPVMFDSDVANQMTMQNRFGKYVKPSRIASTCPDCGQGFILDIRLSDPPFEPYLCSCPVCKPPPPPIPDPFINPLASGKITLNDLDPLLHDIDRPTVPEQTVAERLKILPVSKPQPPQDMKPEKKTVKKPSKKSDDKPKSTDGFANHPAKRLESADGINGEEFDDLDLVE